MSLLLCLVLIATALVAAADILPLWLGWVGSGFLLFLGGWASLANWTIPFRKGGGSLIPLFGGLFAAAGLAVVPVDGLRSLWWVPLLVDLGCAPLMTLTVGFLLYRAVAARRSE